jgi:hypothetical protein
MARVETKYLSNLSKDSWQVGDHTKGVSIFVKALIGCMTQETPLINL